MSAVGSERRSDGVGAIRDPRGPGGARSSRGRQRGDRGSLGDAPGVELLRVLDDVIDARVDARLAAAVDGLSGRIAQEVVAALRDERADLGTGGTLLTVAEAARRLSVSRSTVYVLINRGELSAIRVGGARRIPAEALGAFGSPPTGQGRVRAAPSRGAPAA